MTTVLVTGGSGTLGRHLVGLLREGGHDVRSLSRRPGAGTHQGDLETGAGLDAALDGARVVIHAASDARRMGRSDPAQTANLLQAARGVEHLIYVSIVGIDAIGYRYYRQKLSCEGLVTASGVPSTILRATQFHELLAMALRTLERLPVAPVPSGMKFQPVAARDAARRLAELVDGPPLGRAPDFGGPEVRESVDLARAWQAARGRPRRWVPVRVPGRVMDGFRAGLNTCPDHADGTGTWEEFVAGPGPG